MLINEQNIENSTDPARSSVSIVPRKKSPFKILLMLLIVFIIAAGGTLGVIFALIPYVIEPAMEYQNALELSQEGLYEDAIDSFEQLGGFWDSQKKMEMCKTKLLESNYDNAVALYEAGEYEEAIRAFTELGDYEDSQTRVADIAKLPEEIVLAASDLGIGIGQNITLVADISPETVENKKITWSSSDEKIATIDQDGRIMGIKDGEVIIKATTFNGRESQCNLEVREMKTVRVSTAEQFLSAISSYTSIILEPGIYNLSDANVASNPNIRRIAGDDGYTYSIENVYDLLIYGEGIVTILSNDQYADVLTFTDCSVVKIDNISFGHQRDEAESTCEGSVLNFKNSSIIQIEYCNLFGCGAIGINADHVYMMNVLYCNIYSCTVNALNFDNSDYINIEYNAIFDNRLFDAVFRFNQSTRICINQCDIFDNETDPDMGGLFNLSNAQVEVEQCAIDSNILGYVINYQNSSDSDFVKFDDCFIVNNVGATFLDDRFVSYENCTVQNNQINANILVINAYRGMVGEPRETQFYKNETVFFRIGAISPSGHFFVDFDYIITDPKGNKTENIEMEIFEKDEWAWIRWKYINPAIGSAGTLTLEVIDKETSKTYGSISYELIDS